MFNPFHPFTNKLLEAFIARGKTYFVRQSLKRDKEQVLEGIKGTFLFSHYDNLTTAQDHFGAISYDKNRFLYDYNCAEHREKLLIAASGLQDYRIYACVFRNDWEKMLPSSLPLSIRRYVKSIGWAPKGNDLVDTKFEVQFGELFIHFRYGKREAKVKFEEIEKLL